MNVRRHQIVSQRSGFSLVEVLLGIFILGIGVIAIAALFPAGIAQQRQSVDDIIGPIVANNALSILRAKLKPDDFGTFEEFGAGLPLVSGVEGDWPWLRPGVARKDDPSTTAWDERGWYDIFSDRVNSVMETTAESPGGWPGSTLEGIPYNLQTHHKPVFITQGERYYPTAPAVAFVNANVRRPKPQYVWECMFRRFQGKILVAVFVYRVSIPGGGSVTYRTPPNPDAGDECFLPYSLPLPQSRAWDAYGLSDADPADDSFVSPGLTLGVYNPQDPSVSWQEPRQWILDQNNGIHRVLSRAENPDTGAVRIELVRPIPAVPDLPAYIIDRTTPSIGIENIVTKIWYIPREVRLDVDGDGSADQVSATLTPIYVSVKGL